VGRALRGAGHWGGVAVTEALDEHVEAHGY
jgi:hypothetical protein